MNHVVKFGDAMIRIGDDRKIQSRTLRLANVLRPAFMRISRVDAEAHHLNVAAIEFRLQTRGLA